MLVCSKNKGGERGLKTNIGGVERYTCYTNMKRLIKMGSVKPTSILVFLRRDGRQRNENLWRVWANGPSTCSNKQQRPCLKQHGRLQLTSEIVLWSPVCPRMHAPTDTHKNIHTYYTPTHTQILDIFIQKRLTWKKPAGKDWNPLHTWVTWNKIVHCFLENSCDLWVTEEVATR